MATTAPNTDQLVEAMNDMNLTESQAAKLVGVEPITMRMWRWRDRTRAEGAMAKSPPYKVVGTRSIRYPLSSLREWLRNLPTVDGVPQLPDNRINNRPAKRNAQPAATV